MYINISKHDKIVYYFNNMLTNWFSQISCILYKNAISMNFLNLAIAQFENIQCSEKKMSEI